MTQVLHLMRFEKTPDSTTSPTVFDAILYPDLSKGQHTPSLHDLAAEAMLMVGAGTDTTANALALGTWYLLNDPIAMSKLKAELWEAMPGETDAELTEVEALPYLVERSCPMCGRELTYFRWLSSKRA